MRAIRIHKTGGPEVLQLEDVDLAAPGPGTGAAFVTTPSASITSTSISAPASIPRRLPVHPRQRGRGRGRPRVGPGVEGFRAGDRVAYVTTPGSYAEARNVDVKHLVKLPDGVSHEQAAAMMLKGLTAQYLLRQTYRVQPGDTILVHAAAGGVGQILCQWGKHLGATVIGTVGSPAKAEIAKGLRRRSRHQLLHGGFRRPRRRDHQGRQMRRRLRRRRQGDLPRFARLPEALRRVRELRLGLRAGRGVQPRPARRRRARCSRPGRPCSPSSPTAPGWRRWRRSCSRSSAPGVVKVEISDRAPLADAARVHRDLEGAAHHRLDRADSLTLHAWRGARRAI